MYRLPVPAIVDSLFSAGTITQYTMIIILIYYIILYLNVFVRQIHIREASTESDIIIIIS